MANSIATSTEERERNWAKEEGAAKRRFIEFFYKGLAIYIPEGTGKFIDRILKDHICLNSPKLNKKLYTILLTKF